jgi:class 3 adenylate cyclase
MSAERQQLEETIAALGAQRAVLGDAVVAMAIAPLQERLTALRARAQGEQQLKTVSILFMDVVGSTQLSEHLDPEDVHAVMDAALERLSALVRVYRGRVLKYAGDSLLAAFGAEQALEGDAERAVRAGLAILEEAPRLAAEIRAAYGLRDFNLRVGINTGRVLLGGGVDAESSIRGTPVNIAARMEQTAPPGGLRISHDTYRHVRGVFDVEAQAPIEIKGITGPVRSYLVLRAKPRAFRVANRGVDGIDSPMVGRDAELARIAEIFQRMRDEEHLALVTVVGEPGIGKSRLGFEFTHWLELLSEPVRFFQGRPQQYGNNVTFGLLRDLLAWRFEILESDSQAAAQAKLAQGFGQVLGERAPEYTALIGQMIGFDYASDPHIAAIASEGKQIRDRAFHALAEYFRLLHRQDGAPIVLLIDDLHWADDGSLEFVQSPHAGLPRPADSRPRLDARNALREPAALGQRPEQPPAHRPRAAHQARDARASRNAARRLETVPAALRDLLASSAEGNPYFVEELVGMLIDDGVIITTEEPWRVVGDKLLQVNVPTTLTGVLQARIDSLPAPEKAGRSLNGNRRRSAIRIPSRAWSTPDGRRAPPRTTISWVR